MNNHDAPTHTRLRSLVGRAFTPRQVQLVRPRIHQLAHDLADSLIDAAEADLVSTFCNDLPLIVLCDMLGVPPSDYRIVERWTTLVGLSFSSVIPGELLDDIDHAVQAFSDYADQLIDQCRAKPREDLLSALVHAEEAGDRLSREELKALIVNVLFAGHDTTKSLLGIGIWALCTHPDQLARLRAEPELAGSAVEEIARYETPISGIPRVTSQDMAIDGFPVPAGSYITLSVPSANRDPRRFPDPDRFDIGRTDHRHLTFGFGVHHCVGAAVARAEVQEGLSVLFERCELTPSIDEPTWVPFAAARRYDALPCTITARN